MLAQVGLRIRAAREDWRRRGNWSRAFAVVVIALLAAHDESDEGQKHPGADDHEREVRRACQAASST
jgi:hypothetical protein